MLQQLRGRNLAHVGCTIGLTLGLTLGLIAAVVVIALTTRSLSTSSAVNVATVIWIGSIVALGLAGYWAGGQVSRRLWGKKSTDGQE